MIRNAQVIGVPTVSTLVGGYFWGANNPLVLVRALRNVGI